MGSEHMTEKIIKCSNCREKLALTERTNKIFCLYCGTENLLTDVIELPEVELNCLSCSARNKDNSIFCSKCGAKLQKECPSCNGMHTYDAVFCPETGHNINLNNHKPEFYIKSSQKCENIRTELYLRLTALDKIENLYHNEIHVTGITGDYIELDKITAGFQPGELIIIDAHNDMLKTALAFNIAQFVALEEKQPVGIFNLNISKEQVVQHLICSRATIDLHRFKRGYLHYKDWPKLAQAVPEILEASICIDDTPFISIKEIRDKSLCVKMRKNIKLLIIDYLQLIDYSQFKFTKTDICNKVISEVSRDLKILAKDLEIPIIACSLLSRDGENWREAQLPDMSKSDAIEVNDTESVAFIYRDDCYNFESDKPGTAEIIIAKQRNEDLGTSELLYLKQYITFVSKDKYDESS